MYCDRCNKQFDKKDKFCNECGEPLKVKLNTTNNSNKKKKKTKIISLIIISIALVVASTVFFIVSLINYINNMGKMEYIKLGNEKVPTMYLINNSIQIDEYEKEIEGKEIEVEISYYDNLYSYDMINEYVSYLEKHEFVCSQKKNNQWHLVKKSIDNGMIIIVNVYENYDYDGNMYFTIIYEKKYADYSKYVKEITYKRVGEEKYGYIDIDSTWNPYLNSKDMLQYEGEDGFLSLYYVENPNFNTREYMGNIQNYLIKKGVTDIEITEVKVSEYDAYQLYGYSTYDKMYLVIWCFMDNNNTIHYIELDSIDSNSEIFSKIGTYSITE